MDFPQHQASTGPILPGQKEAGGWEPEEALARISGGGGGGGGGGNRTRRPNLTVRDDIGAPLTNEVYQNFSALTAIVEMC